MSYNPRTSSVQCKRSAAGGWFAGMGMIAAVAGSSWLSATADAQPKPSEVSQLPTVDLAKMIDGNPDIGFVLTVKFDGSIDLYATENGQFAEEPVAIPMDRLGESTLFIQVFEESPGTITIYINGRWVTINN
jgi:hypothetical protein